MTNWVEKYRPETLDEVIGQEGTIKIMKSFVNQEKNGKNELPHFLFSGPTGVGKTATAKAFAKDLWGDEWRTHWSDYNASDERGIDVIRNEIKPVAKQSGMSEGYRVIFLDECDNLTDQSQGALRRVMEKYTEKTKFILSCNYPAQLIDPLKGRCVHRRFSLVDKEELTKHLKKICDKEDVNYDPEALELIADKTDGKVRDSIQAIQSLGTTQKITKDWVEAEMEQVSTEEIGRIFSMIQGGTEGKEIKKRRIDEEVIKLYQGGSTPREILVSFYDYILKNHPEMVSTLVKIGEIDANISQGADPLLQLRCFLFWLIGKVDN